MMACRWQAYNGRAHIRDASENCTLTPQVLGLLTTDHKIWIADKMTITKHQEGVLSAHQDIAADRLRLFSGAPLRSEWGQYLVKTLLNRFGVAVEYESDITDQDRKDFVEGYNATVRSHVDSAYGAGSIASAEDEVQRW